MKNVDKHFRQRFNLPEQKQDENVTLLETVAFFLLLYIVTVLWLV